MFGFGFTEVAVVVILAVMLFPPRELPKIARAIAKIYGQVRRTADQFRRAVLEDEELNAPIREIRQVYTDARYEIRRAEEATKREIAKAKMEARMAANRAKEAVTGKSEAKPGAPIDRDAIRGGAGSAPADAHDESVHVRRAREAAQEIEAEAGIAASGDEEAAAPAVAAPPPPKTSITAGRVAQGDDEEVPDGAAAAQAPILQGSGQGSGQDPEQGVA